jgi:CHASE2 domain-containing sensor protein
MMRSGRYLWIAGFAFAMAAAFSLLTLLLATPSAIQPLPRTFYASAGFLTVVFVVSSTHFLLKGWAPVLRTSKAV